jgi:hypothetical protein
MVAMLPIFTEMNNEVWTPLSIFSYWISCKSVGCFEVVIVLYEYVSWRTIATYICWHLPGLKGMCHFTAILSFRPNHMMDFSGTKKNLWPMEWSALNNYTFFSWCLTRIFLSFDLVRKPINNLCSTKTEVFHPIKNGSADCSFMYILKHFRGTCFKFRVGFQATDTNYLHLPSKICVPTEGNVD